MDRVDAAFAVEDWQRAFDDLPPTGIDSNHVVEGVCRMGAGGRFLFASVTLRFEPSDTLRFGLDLDEGTRTECEREGWLKAIWLGVLDVMLVHPATAITRFACTLQAVKTHPVDSSRKAFRLAARKAARMCLEGEKFAQLWP